MTVKNKVVQFYDALGITLALMTFAYFLPFSFPLRCLSFIALLTSAVLIGKNVKSVSDVKMITGKNLSTVSTLGFSALGIAGGLVLALFYRNYLELKLIPDSLQSFAIIAALIGSTEELIFRGFIQNLAKGISGLFSILFSSLSHTGYKCFLFLSPVITENVDLSFLFYWTFGIGLVFGTFRHFTKSIWIPLTAHMIFDVLVYGELAQAPGWVW